MVKLVDLEGEGSAEALFGVVRMLVENRVGAGGV